MRCPEIIDRRIIKGLCPPQKPDTGIPGKFFVILKNLLCSAVIFHNNDFKILIICITFQRFHTSLQSFFFIFIGDDHRYQRLPLNRILDTVKSQIRGMAYHSPDTSSFQVFFNGTLSGFKSIHLTCRIVRSRCFMGSPVIEDLRYMNYFPGSLCATENKIIILRSVKFPAKTSRLLHHTSANHKKMADIIIRP